MDTVSCGPSCGTTLVTTNVPGDSGSNAYTTTLANFTLPAVDATVAVQMGDTSWLEGGATIFISDGLNFAHMVVQSVSDSTHATLVNSGASDDAVPTTVIGSGSLVAPSGGQQDLTTAELKALNTTLLAAVGALTDSTGGVASDTLAAGVGIFTVALPLTSLATGLSTGALDLMTNYTPGYAFKILKFDWVTTIVGAGAGATQTFNLEIGTTNVTGGVVNPTLASTATIGVLTAGTAVSANNTGTSADTISVEMAAGGTVFSSGAGYFLLKLQNLDTTNALASLAAKINAIRAALKT